MTPLPVAFSEMYKREAYLNHPAVKLLSAWMDYQVWLMLQYKFMSPARMIARGGEMETFMKQYSLNGIKSFNFSKFK